MKIFVNTIVNNEENFIWFAVMSVVDFVDKILIWDTGSTDKTVEIIKEIMKDKKDKIDFRECGEVDENQFTRLRQQMLEQSDCDWILILDGDEIWWENSIKKMMDNIREERDKIDAIVVPFYTMVGDIYHYQSESAGQYQLLGKKGHLTIKAVRRKIEGLHWSGPYGSEGLYDKDNNLIQDKDKIIFLDAPFMHLTHLQRSSVDKKKFKYDLGNLVSKNFKFPEVFYKEIPQGIPSPWIRRPLGYEIVSTFKYPLLQLWRELKNR